MGGEHRPAEHASPHLTGTLLGNARSATRTPASLALSLLRPGETDSFGMRLVADCGFTAFEFAADGLHALAAREATQRFHVS